MYKYLCKCRESWSEDTLRKILYMRHIVVSWFRKHHNFVTLISFFLVDVDSSVLVRFN